MIIEIPANINCSSGDISNYFMIRKLSKLDDDIFSAN